MPWRAQHRRDEQDGAEVHDRGRAKGANLQHASGRFGFGDQCDHNELQARQRSGRRAYDHIETFPGR